MSLAAAHAARTAKSHAMFARLVEASKTAKTAAEQAAALGIPAKNIKFLRYHARRAGFDLDGAGADVCSRCPRRGPHQCENMPTQAEEAVAAAHVRPAGRRTGTWSAGEDAVLIANYKKVGPPRTAELLGRTLSSTYMRAERLKIRVCAKWTPPEDRRLMMLWGDVPLATIAETFGRTELACAFRAKRIGLKLGIQPGSESMDAAAKRTGFSSGALQRILSSYGVKLQPLLSLAKTETGAARMGWDPFEVDDAIKKWNETENLSEAAARRGLDDDTLARWIKGSHHEKPTHGRRWRIPTKVIDKVIADRQARETVMAAAKRVGVNRYVLARMLKAAGIPRGKGYWRIERAVIDRVVAERRNRCP